MQGSARMSWDIYYLRPGVYRCEQGVSTGVYIYTGIYRYIVMQVWRPFVMSSREV